MSSLRTGLCCIALALCAQTVEAAIVLSLTVDKSDHTPAGGTTIFTVTLTGDAGETLSAYDIFIDVSDVDLNNPVASPVRITNISSLAFANSPFFAPQNPAGNGRDFGVSDATLTTPLSTAGGLSLFSFEAVFGPTNAPNGLTFDFSMTPSAPGFGLRLGSGPVTDFSATTFRNSTVTVGVPEPCSLTMLVVIATGTSVLTRRRRRRLC